MTDQPTDQNPEQEAPSPWEVPKNLIGEDGKLLGQFENMQAVLDAAARGVGMPAQAPAEQPVVAEAPDVPLEGLQIPEPPPGATKLTAERMQALGGEALANGGKLTDESYTELEGLGYTRDLVDSHIAGQMALQQQATQTIYQSVGGQAAAEKALKWAASNLDAAEKASINKTLATADASTAALILKGLMSRAGIMGGNVQAMNSPPMSAQPFETYDALVAAQGDPRYRKDPEFRQAVEARARVSMQLGKF